MRTAATALERQRIETVHVHGRPFVDAVTGQLETIVGHSRNRGQHARIKLDEIFQVFLVPLRMAAGRTACTRQVWRKAVKALAADKNRLFWKVNHGCSPVRLCDVKSVAAENNRHNL
jgi:hypothetical protein